ncbi:MAG: hypothetical protein MESAZ_00017 [Saezia sanguinis]
MSSMTHLSTPPKTISIWQRLLAVFNLNDPQWGRPTKPQNDDSREGDQSGSPQGDREPEDDQDGRKGQSDNQPGQQGKQPDGPPDLDEIWRDVSGKLGSWFGGAGNGGKGSDSNGGGNSGNNGGWGGGNGNGSSGNQRPPMQVSGKGAGIGVGFILLVIVAGWLASGIFTVQEGQKSVILTFGEYTREVGPGLQWHLPYPIQSRETVATEQLRSINIGNSNINSVTGLSNAAMLTQDKNILEIRFTVQYRINDIRKFLFVNAQTEDAVVLAAESAVREVVGSTPMDIVIKRESCLPLAGEHLEAWDDPCFLMNPRRVVAGNDFGMQTSTLTLEESAPPGVSKRQSLAALMMSSIQNQLNKLNAGIEVYNVNILDVQVPAQVKPAFDEARSATAEKESRINEGRAYANQRVASAEGVVARLREDAGAYRARVTAQAQGDTERFLQIYEQYRLAPEVTRNRMYLETMQDIFGNVTKVIVDSRNNSMLYLPLDRILNQSNAAPGASGSGGTAPAAPAAAAQPSSSDSPLASSNNTAINGSALGDRSRDAFGRDRY